jgi:hypothetical protein
VVASRFAHTPGRIKPGQIGHRKRPHRKTEFFQCRVDFFRMGAFFQHEFALTPIGGKDAVADEAFANARDDGEFA